MRQFSIVYSKFVFAQIHVEEGSKTRFKNTYKCILIQLQFLNMIIRMCCPRLRCNAFYCFRSFKRLKAMLSNLGPTIQM